MKPAYAVIAAILMLAAALFGALEQADTLEQDAELKIARVKLELIRTAVERARPKHDLCGRWLRGELDGAPFAGYCVSLPVRL